MKSLLTALVAAALLAGCATDYQSQGFTGGFTETQLNPNVYRVSFIGNGYTSMERAADFTLLRCAELSLQNGYSHFAIIDGNQWTKTETYVTPTTTNTTFNAHSTGNNISGSATSTTTGGQVYNFQKPRSTNTIFMISDPAEVNGLAYDAGFLLNSLKRKYGIE